MKKTFLVLCTIAALALQQPNLQAQSTVTKIAFGSCSRQDLPQPLWNDVVNDRPDVWVWLGDNVYGDTDDMGLLKAKYDMQKKHPGYDSLRRLSKIFGIWDDHDYGKNDAGKEYAYRSQSRDLMYDFLDVPANSPFRQHQGGYQSYTLGPDSQQVKLILLDGRYFRDSLAKNSSRQNIPNTTGDVLGEAQWQWLENELRGSKAKVHLIGCGIQFLAEEHVFEKWGNFPLAKQRFLNLLSRTEPAGVVLLSGDRHIAEFSRTNVEGLLHPLYDVTSSGLTHVWATPRFEPNRFREGPMVYALNYGLIEIDWNARPLRLTLMIKGNENTTLLRQVVDLP
jgi:alkaline phosphatase D